MFPFFYTLKQYIMAKQNFEELVNEMSFSDLIALRDEAIAKAERHRKVEVKNEPKDITKSSLIGSYIKVYTLACMCINERFSGVSLSIPDPIITEANLKLMKKHVPDLVAEEELEIGIIFDFTNPLSNSNGRYVVKEKEGRESVTINDPLKELIVNKICK